MKEERFFYNPDTTHSCELPDEESIHAIRVLRLKSGDEIWILDGRGNVCKATITLITSKRCIYEVTETIAMSRQWKGKICLAIAPTKNMDRMEWMVEKATEIGVDEIVFLDCKFSERHTIRIDRIEKIIIAAMKQSRKGWKPTVKGIMPFNDFIAHTTEGRKFIAHCYNEFDKTDFYEEVKQTPSDESITIMVGPEGDFSVDEVKNANRNGFTSVTLGTSRLRTETAGMVAINMMQIIKSR